MGSRKTPSDAKASTTIAEAVRKGKTQRAWRAYSVGRVVRAGVGRAVVVEAHPVAEVVELGAAVVVPVLPAGRAADRRGRSEAQRAALEVGEAVERVVAVELAVCGGEQIVGQMQAK